MTPLHRTLLLLISLWLPLQGYAAAAMAACRHASPVAAMVQVQGHAHHASAMPSEPADPAGMTGSASWSCDNCQFCHLCSAQAVAAVAAGHMEAPGGPVLIAPLLREAAPPLEDPRRPPRSARA